MLMELAFAIEPAHVVADRFGYSSTEYGELAMQPWFQKELSKKQAELADQGWTFRAKMGMLAEDLLRDVYVSAKASDSVSLKLEAAKYLTKIADLEPKAAVSSLPGGGGFMISINLGSDPALNKATIEMPKDVTEAEFELGHTPSYLNFGTGSELAGTQP
jgi:hypothetical protein